MSDPTTDAPTDPPDPAAQRSTLMAAALKQKLPLAVLDPTCQWTDNKDQAAVTALNNAAAASTSRENGGAIFQNLQGQYCYSIPVGDKEASHFQLRAQSTPEQKLVGIYHTHPASGGGEDGSFSPDDVATANQLKMQSYIKALKSGEVKRYDPGVSPTVSVGVGIHSLGRKSAGTLVPQTDTTAG